jgi:hypothetical protein
MYAIIPKHLDHSTFVAVQFMKGALVRYKELGLAIYHVSPHLIECLECLAISAYDEIHVIIITNLIGNAAYFYIESIDSSILKLD